MPHGPDGLRRPTGRGLPVLPGLPLLRHVCPERRVHAALPRPTRVGRQPQDVSGTLLHVRARHRVDTRQTRDWIPSRDDADSDSCQAMFGLSKLRNYNIVILTLPLLLSYHT